jgi:hypothetical protein
MGIRENAKRNNVDLQTDAKFSVGNNFRKTDLGFGCGVSEFGEGKVSLYRGVPAYESIFY